MRFLVRTLFAAALALSTPAFAQQVADPNVDISVVRPAYAQSAGPRVVIDAAHHNFHTVDGRFAPFAGLLRNDGFRVEGRDAPFTADGLKDVDILVIANPLNAVNDTDDGWKLPTPSAFTTAEIVAVRQWVENGGSLLLIADHMPFAGAADQLAGTFGFRFSNGFARRAKVDGPDLFSIKDGTLKDDPVTRGRGADERVDRLRTFTGSAFRGPPEARPLIVFPKGYVSLEPQVAWRFEAATLTRDIEGGLQGAVIKVGKGRVAVFGEAAMFTAQVSGPQKTRIGFNAPDAPRNKVFVLNVVRWLGGVLE